MFEFSIALKYLIPRRKQLSVSLIALMSVAVISLVVWLVLVFLSVTEGIERSWLDKLTKLNAPLRITPTQEYYSSYYYNIDALSSASHFHPKSLSEKALAESSDPYVPEEDEELPFHFPLADRGSAGALRDPVKIAYQILSEMQQKHTGLSFQDYEVGGALMRLQMIRSTPNHPTAKETQSFLTQVSYVASFADKSPYVASLVQPPRHQDLDHLFFLSSHTLENPREDAPTVVRSAPLSSSSSLFKTLAAHCQISRLKSSKGFWKLPSSLIPSQGSFSAIATMRDGKIAHIALPSDQKKPRTISDQMRIGKLIANEGQLRFETASREQLSVSPSTPLIVDGELTFNASLVSSSLDSAQTQQDIQFEISGTLQGQPLHGIVPWNGLEIAQADITTQFSSQPPSTLPWLSIWQTAQGPQALLPMNAEREAGVLLAKNFQDNGVLIGDRGYLSYTTASLGSIQEQRLPIFVAGFYDPGVLSVGSKFILVPGKIAQAINASSSSFNLDKLQSNGIQVWFEHLKDAQTIKAQLVRAFEEAGIDSYWNIATYHDYDFAKDLLQQFQSDKTLFTLIGGIILIVACCNIISLLVLLVNDKKQQIGILQAMGASSRSIALIFGTSGALLGILSSLIGTAAALYTLHHIDSLVGLLSMIQGHDAFNAAFYGKSLPNELSRHAVIFVLIATPLISLCAGLVPAIKACRLRPSAILRSE
jgi:lipoprotein-releasing system permease protein